MIHSISIENFFSIADRQELIFKVPANAPNLNCFRPSPSDENARLPLFFGFFGPNASGKSTILRAAVSIILFLYQSFNIAPNIMFSLFQPYRQKKWWEKPTKIVMEFDCSISKDSPPVIFRYELHLGHEINRPFAKTVIYESLFYAPRGRSSCLFERHKQEFRFGKEFDISINNDPRKEMIPPGASVISTLAKVNHKICQHMVQQIGTLQTNIIGFDKIQPDSTQWLSLYNQDKTCLDQLNRELRRFDVGLESMHVERSDHGLYAKFKHFGLDEFIYLKEESSGTQRFIEIFPRIHYALQTGSIAIIDELDNDLHPLLTPELFRWFSDPKRNPYGAQLFFTAHNPALLDDMEKEQVFFTTKPSGQATQVYCASNIKGLRREPSLMKKYLSGELGAIPHIG